MPAMVEEIKRTCERELGLIRGAEPHADDRAMEFRRSAHQANAALWGIEASTRLMLAFLTPGANGTVDVALVSGFLGLRRMRRDQSWPVARRRVLGHAESDRHHGRE